MIILDDGQSLGRKNVSTDLYHWVRTIKYLNPEWAWFAQLTHLHYICTTFGTKNTEGTQSPLFL